MKGKFTVLLLLLALVLCALPVAQASASSGHDHEMISPFDKQHHNQKLHCDLNMFHQAQTYCPHNGAGRSEGKKFLSPYCGGKTSGAIPAFGSHNANDFSASTCHFEVDRVLITQPLFPLSNDIGFFPPFQLDRPPQSI